MDSVFNRRSIRKFTDDKVTDEQIRRIIKAGMAAPSAKNSQEWVFILIKDKEKMASFTNVHPNAFPLKTAPAAILVCSDSEKELDPANDWWIQDCSAAMENMLIEATESGLSSLWIGVYPVEERIESVKSLFMLPENIKPLGLMAVGVGAKKKEPNDRYMAERVFLDSYGQLWNDID